MALDADCYLPLYIFCGPHLLAAKQRCANIDGAAGAVEEAARIIAQIRTRWPQVRIARTNISVPHGQTRNRRAAHGADDAAAPGDTPQLRDDAGWVRRDSRAASRERRLDLSFF